MTGSDLEFHQCYARQPSFCSLPGQPVEPYDLHGGGSQAELGVGWMQEWDRVCLEAVPVPGEVSGVSGGRSAPRGSASWVVQDQLIFFLI